MKPLKLLSILSLGLIMSAYGQLGFNGFYGGVGGGGVETKGKFEYSGSVTQAINPDGSDFLPFPADYFSGENTGTSDSGLGTAFLGYGHRLATSPFYLGGEVFVDVANRNFSNQQSFFDSHTTLAKGNVMVADNANTIVNNSAKLKTWEYGVDIRPGFLFNHSMLLYGRVGAVFNQATLSSNDMQNFAFVLSQNGASVTVPASSALNFSRKKNLTGLRLGGGLEDKFRQHWSIRADYIYTNYGTLSASQSGPTTAASLQGVPVILSVPNGFIGNAKVKLSSNAVLLGLSYYFGCD